MFNEGASRSWFRQNIWNPFINDGVYAYQEWVDKGIATVVPESKENIDISDRAAVVLTGWVGLWTAPVSVPLAVAGCGSSEEGSYVSGEDIYVPEPEVNAQEDIYVPGPEIKTEMSSLGMCKCQTNPQYFDCLDATCGTSFTSVTAKDIASCLDKDISTSEPTQITIGLDYKTAADTCYENPKLSVSIKGEKAAELSFFCNSFETSSIAFCVPAGTSLSDITLELAPGDWCSSVLFTSIATTNDPSCVPQCIDKDEDGYGENCALGADCDDANSQIFPGALELCNDIDDNCDGKIDEGYSTGESCTVGVGLCVNSGKYICSPSGLDVVCDAKPLPPQEEIMCNGKDEDCDGSDFKGTDLDKDGYAVEGGTCGLPDCDDTNNKKYPSSLNEFAEGLAFDGIDNNCDGLVDEIILNEDEKITLSDLPGYHDLIHLKSNSSIGFTSDNVHISAGIFIMEDSSVINISGISCDGGDGYNGSGDYDGGGGGGGSFMTLGGSGGCGGWKGIGGKAGKVYGSVDDFVAEIGSCGGNGGGPYGASGGKGGGALTIEADTIEISGRIFADGENGEGSPYDDGGPGGGTGGSIVLIANVINYISGLTYFSVKGGNGGGGGSGYAAGGGGGGGGSGGIIKIAASLFNESSSAAEFTDMMMQGSLADVSGGSGGTSGLGTSSNGCSGIPGNDGVIIIGE